MRFPESIKGCGGCRFWSEMIARAGGGTTNPRGDVEALCLVAGGPQSGKYTTRDMTCPQMQPGLVAVDDPHGDGKGGYAQ